MEYYLKTKESPIFQNMSQYWCLMESGGYKLLRFVESRKFGDSSVFLEGKEERQIMESFTVIGEVCSFKREYWRLELEHEKRKRAPKTYPELICLDCGKEVRTFVMLRHEIWAKIAQPRDMLCFDCMERSLGRQITPADLLFGLIAKEFRLGYYIYNRPDPIGVSQG